MFFDELDLIEMRFNFYEALLKNRKVRFDRTCLTFILSEFAIYCMESYGKPRQMLFTLDGSDTFIAFSSQKSNAQIVRSNLTFMFFKKFA